MIRSKNSKTQPLSSPLLFPPPPPPSFPPRFLPLPHGPRLSPLSTRPIANLFRRVGDGVGRNRSTLYSSRIDRQPRTDMEALYFPSSHLRPPLQGPLVNKASTFLASTEFHYFFARAATTFQPPLPPLPFLFTWRTTSPPS